MKRIRKPQPIPPVPFIDYAISRVQFNADSSMLPQRPYATYVEGFGWVIDSVAEWGQFPSNAGHIYEVSVLPARYFT